MTTKEVNDRNWKVPFWIGVTLVSCAMNVVFLEKLVRQVTLYALWLRKNISVLILWRFCIDGLMLDTGVLIVDK